MSDTNMLWIAFENVAAYITNLDEVRAVIDDLLSIGTTDKGLVAALERRVNCDDITLRTDLKILLNELRHILVREPVR